MSNSTRRFGEELEVRTGSGSRNRFRLLAARPAPLCCTRKWSTADHSCDRWPPRPAPGLPGTADLSTLSPPDRRLVRVLLTSPVNRSPWRHHGRHRHRERDARAATLPDPPIQHVRGRAAAAVGRGRDAGYGPAKDGAGGLGRRRLPGGFGGPARRPERRPQDDRLGTHTAAPDPPAAAEGQAGDPARTHRPSRVAGATRAPPDHHRRTRTDRHDPAAAAAGPRPLPASTPLLGAGLPDSGPRSPDRCQRPPDRPGVAGAGLATLPVPGTAGGCIRWPPRRPTNAYP